MAGGLYMKSARLKHLGSRNLAAVHWHLPTSALYEKIIPRGEKSPKKLLPLSLVFPLSV